MHRHFADHFNAIGLGVPERSMSIDLKMIPGLPIPIPVPSGAPVPGINLPKPTVDVDDDGEVNVGIDTGIEPAKVAETVGGAVDAAGDAVGELAGDAVRNGAELLESGQEVAGALADAKRAELELTKDFVRTASLGLPITWLPRILSRDGDDAAPESAGNPTDPAGEAPKHGAEIPKEPVTGPVGGREVPTAPGAARVSPTRDSKKPIEGIVDDGTITAEEAKLLAEGDQAGVLAHIRTNAEEFINSDQAKGYQEAVTALGTDTLSPEARARNEQLVSDVLASKQKAIGAYQAEILHLRSTMPTDAVEGGSSEHTDAIKQREARIATLQREIQEGLAPLSDTAKEGVQARYGIHTPNVALDVNPETGMTNAGDDPNIANPENPVVRDQRRAQLPEGGVVDSDKHEVRVRAENGAGLIEISRRINGGVFDQGIYDQIVDRFLQENPGADPNGVPAGYEVWTPADPEAFGG